MPWNKFGSGKGYENFWASSFDIQIWLIRAYIEASRSQYDVAHAFVACA